MPYQHCAVAAIVRFSVLARSRRTLCVKSSGSWGSSTRRPGVGGAVLSSAPATPPSAVGAPRGKMGVSPTGSGLPASIAYSRSHRPRPPQEGVEHVTRSTVTKRAQVSSSTTEPVCWWVMCLIRQLALWKPREGRGRRRRCGTRQDWGCKWRLRDSHARAQKCHFYDLDCLGGPRNERRGRWRQTAAIGGHWQGRGRRLGHSGCGDRRVSEQAGHRTRGLGLFQKLGEVLTGVGAGTVSARDNHAPGVFLGHSTVDSHGTLHGAADLSTIAFHWVHVKEPEARVRQEQAPPDRETPGKNKTVNQQAPHGPAAAGRARESTRTISTDA